MTTRFNTRLESLRGIAALMVALGHSFLVVAIGHMADAYAVHYSKLHTLEDALTRSLFVVFNGGAAVSIFFVLSGYVLGLSLNKKALGQERHSVSESAGFMVRRLFRLFPAHFFSLTLVILSLYFFHSYQVFPNASSWFSNFYRSGLTTDNIIDNYLLLASNLNPVTWTLQVELLMSLLFPLAFVLCRGLGIKGNLIALLVIYYFCMQLKNFYLMFGFVFYAGLFLSQLNPSRFEHLPRVVVNLLLLAGVSMLLGARLVIDSADILNIATMECAGAVLIIFVLANRLEGPGLGRCLDAAWVRHLGRVSYSFYVLHFIVLYWMAYLALSMLSPDWVDDSRFVLGVCLALCSIPVAVMLAHLSYLWVEKPFVKIGAALSSGISAQLARLVQIRQDNPPLVRQAGSLFLRMPGLHFVMAVVAILYLMLSTGLIERSGAFVPLRLDQHSFGLSDFLNFHVLPLAYPGAIALACLHYLNKSPGTGSWFLHLAAYSLIGIFLVSAHFLISLGAKGLQIFQMQDASNFALAWLSSFGTYYYLCWSIVAALICCHLLIRMPVVIQYAALLVTWLACLLLPAQLPDSSWPYLMAPWSPLNALPVASFVVLMHGAQRPEFRRTLIWAGVLVLLASASAVYEWNVVFSEAFDKSQLAVLPIHARLSLVAATCSVLLLASLPKAMPSGFVIMLARAAVPAGLLLPLFSHALLAQAGNLAVDKTSFTHWSFALLFVVLFLAAYGVRRLFDWLVGWRNMVKPVEVQA